MLIAVLFSPGAGGSPSFGEAGEIISRRFRDHAILTCPGPLGANYLPNSDICEASSSPSFVDSIREAARSLARRRPDLLVCVGGDGLASYVADALAGQGAGEGLPPERTGIPLLGVAAGTINVGPIVTTAIGELEDLDPTDLLVGTVGAIEVVVGRRRLALGFNDVVLANTFLGTVDGSVESLSARAMALRGERLPEEPDPRIATEAFRVSKNGLRVGEGMAKPSQIVASPLGKEEFYARAVAGVLCEAGWRSPLAALALLDSVIVRSGPVRVGLSDFSRVDHLLFAPGDRISIEGLSPAAQVVADGNPFAIDGGTVELAYLPEVASVARPPHRPRGRMPCT